MSGNSLPPADCAALVAAHPELCWAIALFDIWVLNSDRHPRNIAFDTTTNTAQIFDHSHALFVHAVAQLPNLANQLGFGGQCLAQHFTSPSGLDDWCNRFAAIPELFIRTVVLDVAEAKFNLTAPTAGAFADFLVNRRSQLKNLVLANQASFPGINAATWAAATAAPGAVGPPPAAAAPKAGGAI